MICMCPSLFKAISLKKPNIYTIILINETASSLKIFVLKLVMRN